MHLGRAPQLPRIAIIIAHFSMENHHFSGEIPHYLCIFNRKFKKLNWHLCYNSYLSCGVGAIGGVAVEAVAHTAAQVVVQAELLALSQQPGRARMHGAGRADHYVAVLQQRGGLGAAHPPVAVMPHNLAERLERPPSVRREELAPQARRHNDRDPAARLLALSW